MVPLRTFAPTLPPMHFQIPCFRTVVVVAAAFLASSVLLAQSTPPTVPAVDPMVSDWRRAWSAPEPWRTDRFYFQTSVATVHFSSNPDHVNDQKLIYGEYRMPYYGLGGQWFAGAAFLDNSFGQDSQFVFGGLLWRPIEKAQEFYIKVAAGIIHGYRGEFQNKIPMNSSGFAPGIVPAVGYCYNRFCGEMVLFGGAGMMWTLGMTVP